MWFFRRSDVNLRNEWMNYTNWKYDYLPNNVIKSNSTNTYTVGSTILTQILIQMVQVLTYIFQAILVLVTINIY